MCVRNTDTVIIFPAMFRSFMYNYQGKYTGYCVAAASCQFISLHCVMRARKQKLIKLCISNIWKLLQSGLDVSEAASGTICCPSLFYVCVGVCGLARN